MNNGHYAAQNSQQAAALALAATGVDVADFPMAVDTSEWGVRTVTDSDTGYLSPRLLGRLTSEERKEYPVTRGVLDYFPDALALVSHLSWAGNEKHNPGQTLHWARSKGGDNPDCIGRHLIERDGSDFISLEDGRRIEIAHRVAIAWRALAELQLWAEQEYSLGMAPGAQP